MKEKSFTVAILVMMLVVSAVAPAIAAEKVFVKSLADSAFDCQPDYPTPPPTCAKSREVVKDLKKQLAKSKHFTIAASKDDADLAVEVMLVLKDSGKYFIRDHSVSMGRTTIVDVDIREIKVEQILTSVYRGTEMDEMFRAKSVNDLRKKLEKLYRK